MALKNVDTKTKLVLEIIMALFFTAAMVMYGSVILGYFRYVFSFFK